MEEPETDAEWQEAADAAHAMLLLDAAQGYGFLEGGPAVDADRCEQVLADAQERGIYPTGDAPDRLAREIVATNGGLFASLP